MPAVSESSVYNGVKLGSRALASTAASLVVGIRDLLILTILKIEVKVVKQMSNTCFRKTTQIPANVGSR